MFIASATLGQQVFPLGFQTSIASQYCLLLGVLSFSSKVLRLNRCIIGLFVLFYLVCSFFCFIFSFLVFFHHLFQALTALSLRRLLLSPFSLSILLYSGTALIFSTIPSIFTYLLCLLYFFTYSYYSCPAIPLPLSSFLFLSFPAAPPFLLP